MTVDEFKGRKPVVRGGLTVSVDPLRCRNPRSDFHLEATTSGSRSPGTPVLIDLAYIQECAVDTLLALDARGGAGAVKGHWQVPGGGAIARLVEYSTFGSPVARWFSQVDPAAPGLHPRYRWSARAMRWAGRLAGVRLPGPQHVPLDEPAPIVRWMAEVLRGSASPHVFSFTSSVVRLCQAAEQAGVDLTGARFTVVGEPVTATRVEAIRRTGAEVVPRYAIIECSAIGHGCLNPAAPDEVHFLSDLHALIQRGPDVDVPALPHGALFLSSLRLSAPYVLLNVSMGDEAVVSERRCGCPLERLGWMTHLETIRSHEKLTAGGMTVLDHDVIRVLEEALPARFGGGPTDYQIVEDEDQTGHPRLRLIAHPRLGPLDEPALIDAFLSAVGRCGGAETIMARVWRDSHTLRVERRPLDTTATGKVLHLHVRRGRPAGAEALAGASVGRGRDR